ncbi:MAG: hypothetical protein Faunusvirus1_10 [Faunusvirus sp.]|jgi:hypothetical protein|uniref:Uncharacterized protein n=1 Tax=Faunusvirus sp. TaxID=2487766 RepID=A0A3G4ZVW5_9VIRU|nr:MAG: hypothetical protein Faunusvirus1_10 [Faunusvirus sp.]
MSKINKQDISNNATESVHAITNPFALENIFKPFIIEPSKDPNYWQLADSDDESELDDNVDKNDTDD